MINVLIVDDEEFSVNAIIRYAARVPFINVMLATTSSVEASIAVQNQPIDLVFSDIHIPELSGLELAKLIQGKSKVIFISAYSDYALEGYKNDVIDYLIKPVTFEQFLKSAQKAERSIELERNQAVVKPLEKVTEPEVNNFLMIKTKHKGNYTKVKYDEIIYVEGTGNYLMICTKSQGEIIALLTFKALEDLLPKKQFMRVHKSYVISLQYVSGINGNDIELGTALIPIGTTYKENFMKYFVGSMV
jgi:two-component system, LytTR family, response regulator